MPRELPHGPAAPLCPGASPCGDATVTGFLERGRLLDEGEIRRAVTRIAHEILERNKGARRLALVGIAARGDDLARRLAAEISRIESVDVPVGVLDITFYRDDIGMRAVAPQVHETRIGVDITHTTVVLVDRGHRELPIRADYVGKNVPTRKDEEVQVRLKEMDGEDAVAVGAVVADREREPA